MAVILQPHVLGGPKNHTRHTIQGSLSVLGQQEQACNVIARDRTKYANRRSWYYTVGIGPTPSQ